MPVNRSWSVRGAQRVLRAMLVRGAFAVLACSFASSVPLAAQDARSSREDLVAKIAGRKIHKDRVTGEVRAITVAEARTLIEKLVELTSRPATAPEPVVGPGGARLIATDHAGHVVISRYNPDGTVSVRCVTSVDEAARFLAEEPLEIQ